ncbi:hypothetical protein [Nostoc sp.]|uniref:hypothetical protein n=1 Tax=Nostoc sp. TaxID=1180 RepID=UPI002FF56B54
MNQRKPNSACFTKKALSCCVYVLYVWVGLQSATVTFSATVSATVSGSPRCCQRDRNLNYDSSGGFIVVMI